MAELDNDKIEMQLQNAGISEEEAYADFEKLQSHLNGLSDFQDSIEDLPEAEQTVAMFRKVMEVAVLLNKYDNPELDEVFKAIKGELDEDSIDDFGGLLEDYREVSSNIDMSEHEGAIEELGTLYENAQNMGGLSDGKKLERYDAFFDKLNEVVSLVIGKDDSDQAIDQIQRQLAMPDSIFPDKMIEYTTLKGYEIKDLVEQADHYTRENALESLREEGIEAPTQLQIEERFIDARGELYDQAATMMEEFKNNIFVDEDLEERIELISGISEEYLDQQQEIIQLENEQLEYAKASEKSAQVTSDSTHNTSVDIASSNTYAQTGYEAGNTGGASSGPGVS